MVGQALGSVSFPPSRPLTTSAYCTMRASSLLSQSLLLSPPPPGLCVPVSNLGDALPVKPSPLLLLLPQSLVGLLVMDGKGGRKLPDHRMNTTSKAHCPWVRLPFSASCHDFPSKSILAVQGG